jgi:anthranilate synthase/indole-3-glycerol phosphate synthase/phosphoribosylanthranilate isomerase
LEVEERRTHSLAFGTFTGGAIGFISYDCIQYFEPKTARLDLHDELDLPESLFMFCDSLIIFDHLRHSIKLVAHVQLSRHALLSQLDHEVNAAYARAEHQILETMALFMDPVIPLPDQPCIPHPSDRGTHCSNVGQQGYHKFVSQLQHHIKDGDIFQAVPSHRLTRSTQLHSFNAYRHLRSSNPSPYMYYLKLNDFEIVGASPEMLAKVEGRKLTTHPIAGTRKRGSTPEHDRELARELLHDEKERAEHVMLVDLGRNDVNRVCMPHTVQVDRLMEIEKYSHVMHLVSAVSGTLREDQSVYNAFRSIFPAGTVSGAPKIKAIQLVRALEKEKRGVYAGAIGHFDYSGDMDMCIAIRTMVFKQGQVYFQAGGGIVFDSHPEEEYQETLSKMRSCVSAVELAEEHHYQLQNNPDMKTRKQKQDLLYQQHCSLKSSRLITSQSAIVPPKDRFGLHRLDALHGPVTVLIDNYDSFVFNLFQYLSQEGAQVVVFRNDEISIAELDQVPIRNIVISPGPGHPKESGISIPILEHFAGKVPILGVCLGEQAMIHCWGGCVSRAETIVHGKTSKVENDQKGIFEGLPAVISVTRYHSLAGDPETIPRCLEITSKTQDGVVMGVRHRTFTVEGVQFHPESVLSEHGFVMLRNFLKLTCGTWEDELEKVTKTASCQVSRIAGQQDILKIICDQRREDINNAMQTLESSLSHLRDLIAAGAAPAIIPVLPRLKAANHRPAIIAEIKRASPSKGMINATANAGAISVEYANGGATMISVLTEPTWFKGSLNDLKQVYHVLAMKYGFRRPCILRKDFIFSEYQVLESRLAGADSILLIVAILSDSELGHLIHLSRSFEMEPLVEVNNEVELQRAIQAGAKLIGVNNRNLHTFQVDLTTTARMIERAPKEIVFCALSGIFGRRDIEPYLEGPRPIDAILVGEALMRAECKDAFIKELWGIQTRSPSQRSLMSQDATTPLIKICGIQNAVQAMEAASAGAHLIGFVLASRSKRKVNIQTLRVAADCVRASSENRSVELPPPPRRTTETSLEWTRRTQTYLMELLAIAKRPLIVGVFVNSTVHEIQQAIHHGKLDIVQLHGEEPEEYSDYFNVPVIKARKIDGDGGNLRSKLEQDPFVLSLLDSPQPGSGVPFDWSLFKELKVDDYSIGIAGGLNVQNVNEAISQCDPFLVDVSSGVEVDGQKCAKRMRAFVNSIKQKLH